MTASLSAAAAFLRIFCAVVLFSLGFVHQPALAAAPLDSFSETYRLPDGTFADICTEGGHHERQPAARPYCEVCLLAASVILPPPGHETWLISEPVSLANPLRQSGQLLGTTAVLRPKSRAPPLSI